MKKILSILLISVLTLSGCSDNNKISIGSSISKINAQHKNFIFLNSIIVYKKSDIFIVVVEKNGLVDKIVEFSSKRNSLHVEGLSLLQIDNINQYLNKDVDEIINNLGEIHADIGSGFYIPSYITSDAYLISFVIEDHKIVEVIKRDLLSNTIVEQFSAV